MARLNRRTVLRGAISFVPLAVCSLSAVRVAPLLASPIKGEVRAGELGEMAPQMPNGTSPFDGGGWVGVEFRAPDSQKHTPSLLDSTDLANAKSYLASLPTRGRVDPVGT